MMLKDLLAGDEFEMDHFIGWKFGVPVKIFNRYNELIGEGRLTRESGFSFSIYWDAGGHDNLAKKNFHYELTPHQQDGSGPVYLVCKNDYNTVYCNARVNGLMSFPVFGGAPNNDVKPYSTATFNIDGKTIKLSAEATAELKKKLGI